MNTDKFVICIVTHSKRFSIFCQTLKSIREQTDIDIYVSVNGDYKKEFNNEYRGQILNECNKYENVYCNFYLTFRGLSKIWNDAIVNTGREHIIVTNDDVIIKENFIQDFIDHIKRSDKKELIRVNHSYSTFYVNKNYIDAAGYFNENYLGIGYEDTEFTRRNIVGEYPTFVSLNYENLSDQYRDLVDQGASITCVKYHNFNGHLFETKGPSFGVNFRPYEKFYMDNYDSFWKFQ